MAEISAEEQVRPYIVWNDRTFDAGGLIERSKPRDAVSAATSDFGDFWRLQLTEAEIRQEVAEEDRFLPAGYLPRSLEPYADGRLRGFSQAGRFRVSLDIPLALTDWAGRRNAAPAPGRHGRRQAETLIGADALRRFAANGARDVKVAVVDGGFDKEYLKRLGAKYPETLPNSPVPRTPLKKPNRWHANMVSRSALALAPDAVLVDFSILPERIDDIDAFSHRALEKLLKLAVAITSDAAKSVERSWVAVCAWGLVSRKYDQSSDWGYSDSPGHALSSIFSILSHIGADIVFSAGNNGLFFPDPRSASDDRGPGRSIFGSGALPYVLTVGAVDATGAWIGESSQGPEPEGFLSTEGAILPRKPDVCAPSWFREEDDRHAISTGTSGACALAAGVVAAIRRRVGQNDLPPRELIRLMRETANRTDFGGGDARSSPSELRLGSGVIDCAALVDRLGANDARAIALARDRPLADD